MVIEGATSQSVTAPQKSALGGDLTEGC